MDNSYSYYPAVGSDNEHDFNDHSHKSAEKKSSKHGRLMSGLRSKFSSLSTSKVSAKTKALATNISTKTKSTTKQAGSKSKMAAHKVGDRTVDVSRRMKTEIKQIGSDVQEKFEDATPSLRYSKLDCDTDEED